MIGKVAGLPQNPPVEVVFRFAVRIERLEERRQIVPVFVTMFTCAISGGAAGINKRNLMLVANAPNGLRIMQVEVVEDGGVFFRRVGASAEVENEADLRGIFFEPGQEFGAVDFRLEGFAFEVAELVRAGEIVHEEEVGDAFVVEFFEEATGDEACCAGEDNHADIFLGHKILHRQIIPLQPQPNYASHTIRRNQRLMPKFLP